MRPTERFSDRVENYIKYRPQYPREVLDFLRAELKLAPSSVVADIGSGTGILSQLFLENGNTVYGVEPNPSMREAGEKLLRDFPSFKSVEGSAEATTLADESVDFVTAGQAFHWFDVPRARRELARILRPDGWAILIWNNRRTESTAFLREFEKLLHEYGTDYTSVSMKYAHEESLQQFFQQGFSLRVFDNFQNFDYEALRGRLLSASYVPLEGSAHDALFGKMRELFEEHQTGGRIKFEYDTQVYYGTI